MAIIRDTIEREDQDILLLLSQLSPDYRRQLLGYAQALRVSQDGS